MVIGVCGSGYCGSSAVTDFLRECDDVSVIPYDIEFMFLYDVDGIDDLRHHLVERPVRFFSSDAAIKRYQKYIRNLHSPNSSLKKLAGNKIMDLTNAYINEITQVRWNGWWHYDQFNASFLIRNLNFRLLPRILRFINILFPNFKLNIYRKGQMYLSVEPNDFDEVTKKYVSSLISIFNTRQCNTVVLDQPYPSGGKSYYQRYFMDELKTIIVIRDPRDVYLAAKMVNENSTWIPTNNVEDYIEYYKRTCLIKPNFEDEGMIVFFEDMIYKYEETISLLSNYLGVTQREKRKYFDPEKSVNNTQLFRKYPEYEEDIKKIEEALSDYLYDYSDIPVKSTWGNSF